MHRWKYKQNAWVQNHVMMSSKNHCKVHQLSFNVSPNLSIESLICTQRYSLGSKALLLHWQVFLSHYALLTCSVRCIWRTLHLTNPLPVMLMALLCVSVDHGIDLVNFRIRPLLDSSPTSLQIQDIQLNLYFSLRITCKLISTLGDHLLNVKVYDDSIMTFKCMQWLHLSTSRYSNDHAIQLHLNVYWIVTCSVTNWSG
jgi:hypothetical protein